MINEVVRPTGRLDRRELLERRLARANRIDQAIKAACSGPIFDGLTLAQIDLDGVLEQSIRALVTVGNQVPEMDVVIYRGPHSPWGLRLLVSGEEVSILPVQIAGVAAAPAATPATALTGEVTAEPEFDFSQAAELAAMMWRNR